MVVHPSIHPSARSSSSSPGRASFFIILCFFHGSTVVTWPLTLTRGIPSFFMPSTITPTPELTQQAATTATTHTKNGEAAINKVGEIHMMTFNQSPLIGLCTRSRKFSLVKRVKDDINHAGSRKEINEKLFLILSFILLAASHRLPHWSG